MPRSHHPDNSHSIDEILPVSDPGAPIEISIENRSGDIRVRGTNRDDIRVRAEKHGNRSSAAYQEARFRIESNNNVVTIAPIFTDGGGAGPNVSVDLDLDLGEMMRGVFGGRLPGDVDPGEIERATRQAERADRAASRQERRGRRGRGFGIFWNSNDVSYEIELEVPRELEYRLRINTMAGDVEVGEMTGSLDLNTASGDMTVTQLTGDLRFNSASGNLTLTQALGQLTANSASGDLEIEGSAFNATTINTVSGDIRLDAVLTGTGPYTIESVSGDIELALAALSPATGADRELAVTFRSMSGDANVDGAFQSRGGRRWTTGGSEAGPTVAVKTVSGDLRAGRGASSQSAALSRHAVGAASIAAPRLDATPWSPPSPAAPPAPPTPPAPPVPAMPVGSVASDPGVVHTGGPTVTPEFGNGGRLALLEAVERGEIDIEEALRQLEERADGDEP